MPIPLEAPPAERTPVVKRTAIGQRFVGALVRADQRDVLKDGQPVVKDNGKHQQEKVLTCLVLPGTTAPAGIGDQVGVPDVGDTVRLILRGKAFADWIEANRGTQACVGDVVEQVTDSAQAYDANGNAKGPAMTTQAEIDQLPRSTTVGIYGPLTVRRPQGDEIAWVARAEQAHAETNRTPVEAPAAGGVDPSELV